MDEIVGKSITKVSLVDDTTLIFTDANGDKYFYVSCGYCCSSTWFSHISGINNLLGQKVNSILPRAEFSDEEQKKAEAEGNYEVLQLYGYDIKTDKGNCFIEFRNDSNGYYGGSCDYVGQEGSELNAKEILADF